MCYNMGNLKNPATHNSILEMAELKKYTGTLSTYPLPLDPAFPLFDWKVLFRHDLYTGLIKDLPDSLLLNNPAVAAKDNRYYFLRDTSISNYDFYKGDVLRNEQSDLKEILAAATFIKNKINTTQPTIILYHLDKITLSKYSLHELAPVFDSYH
jgi:hypothetical protein